MTPTLYYAPGACSFAAHVVLEEIGTAYEAVRINIREGDQHKPEFRAVNPRGRVPALKVGQEVLLESPAILAYLARSHPDADLLPADPWREAQALSWLAYLSSSVHIAFAHVFRPARYGSEASHPDIVSTGRASIADHFADIEGCLPDQGFAFGHYTVVDPYLTVFNIWARRLELPVADWPKYKALADAVIARPATIRAAGQEGVQVPA